VIRAIAEYGFVTSPYPVVLSIENHCCFDQQKVLAKIMMDVLKDKLAMPLKNADGSPVTALPSPMELKYKVLIKGKRLSAKDSADEEAEEDEEDEDEEDGAPASSKKSPKVVSEGIKSPTEAEKDKASKKKKSNPKTHPDLSAITYLGTGKVKAFTPDVSGAIPADMMASYAEGKTYKLAKNPDKVEGWIEHNKKHLRYGLTFCFSILVAAVLRLSSVYLHLF
jgi:hypothetical protein